jgi:hypothetical protein
MLLAVVLIDGRAYMRRLEYCINEDLKPLRAQKYSLHRKSSLQTRRKFPANPTTIPCESDENSLQT